jgi:hypothetical protein
MTITELNEEYKKAFEDMILFGTGVILCTSSGFKHLPFEGLNDNQTAKDNLTSQHDVEGLPNPGI